MNLTGTIHWGTLLQKSDIFLFLKMGIFSLILEKTYFFAIGNMTQNWSSKCAKESGLVYQKYQENNYICITNTYSRQIYIARQRIFWSKLLPDSLNRMNTRALIIF